MSYLDDSFIRPDDSFIRPAKDAEVVAWYRDKPAPIAEIPHRPMRDFRGRSQWYHFSEEERAQIMERKRQKKHVLEAIKLNSGLNGPFNRSVIEAWHRTCELRRMMIERVHQELREGKITSFEAADSLKKYKEEHRRTIAIIRSTRCGSASQWTPLCKYPFYVEPNCHYVPEEDVAKAEAHGVTWHRLYMEINSQLFFRLERRFRTAGRISGFWTAKHDVDDKAGTDAYALLRCMFAFSDRDEVEKLEEEIVWIKMRF